MGRLVPLWAIALLVVGGWIAGRLAGAATDSIFAVLIAGFAVSAGGYCAVALRARQPSPVTPAELDPARHPAEWLRANSSLASFTWQSRAPRLIGVLGLTAAAGALYALNSVVGWTDEPTAGPDNASELLALVSSLIVYPGLYRHAEILLERRARAARRRRLERLEGELRALRAERAGQPPAAVAPSSGDGDDQALEDDWEIVVGWRYSHLALIAVLLLGVGSACIVLLLLSDVEIVGKVVLLASLTVFVSTGTWIQVASAVGHRVALQIDDLGVNVAERGVMPWKEIQGCVLFVFGGIRYFSVIPRGDKDALLRASWTTDELRRAVRLRGTWMTIPARQLAATPAELALAFEQLGHPLTHME